MVGFGRGRQCCAQEASEIICKTLFVHIKLAPAQQDMKLEIADKLPVFSKKSSTQLIRSLTYDQI